MGRKNLRVESGCLAEAVEFDGKRASGVRWRQNGEMRSARRRGEVVLSAGAIGSPHLLMLSGVGPAAHLAQHGIEARLDRVGVGSNLQDHLQLRTIYKVSGVKTLNAMNAKSLRPRGHGSRLFTAPARADDHGAVRNSAPSPSPTRCRTGPISSTTCPAFVARQVRRAAASVPGIHRERCKLAPDLARCDHAGNPPIRPSLPAIAPNYLSTPEDRRVAADPISRHAFDRFAGSLRKYAPVEYLPGEQVSSDDEAALEKAAGNIGTTIFHPVRHRAHGPRRRSARGGRCAAARDRH